MKLTKSPKQWPGVVEGRRRVKAEVKIEDKGREHFSNYAFISSFAITSAFIFLLSALVGVWAAYDRSMAWGRFTLIALGLLCMLVIAWSGRHGRGTVFGFIGIECTFLAAGIGGYFLLTNDWSAALAEDFSPFQSIGLLIQRYRPEIPFLDKMHSNLAASGLILLMPLGWGGATWAWKHEHRLLAIFSTAALLFAFMALLLTESRGAWLGFSTATVCALYLHWRFRRGYQSPLRWVGDLLLIGGVLALLFSFLAILASPTVTQLLSRISGGALGRVDLWRDSLGLMQDYRFTGSGLGSTTMVYSSYLFLVHVPFLPHAHNLFMQIGIEQGVPGIIAFTGLVVAAIWTILKAYGQHHYSRQRFCTAAIASLVALLVHGLFDAESYARELVALLFIPFGIAFGVRLPSRQKANLTTVSQTVLGGLVPVVVIVVLFLLPGANAALRANLGAVAQTRAELGSYHWPRWPMQDVLRRSGLVDLETAQNHYLAALSSNPDKESAHRRLGHLALAMDDHELARRHLESAYQLAPEHRVTRQLLGELYALAGDVETAATLWQTVDTQQGQLNIRIWWYEYIRDWERAEQMKQIVNDIEY